MKLRGSNEELEDVVDDLRDLKAKFEAERNRRQALEEDVEELASAVEAEREEKEALRDDVATLKSQLGQLAGLADGEKSTADTRRRDLLVTLKRKAERNGGRWAMDYNHVKDDLAALGHMKVDDKQAFRDMEKIAERFRGVSLDSHPTTGNKAVLLNLTEFNGRPSEETGVSDNVSRNGTQVGRSETQTPQGNAVNETT